METEEFQFKKDADMEGIVKEIRKSMADQIGVDPSKIKCKGFRLFFVDEDSQMLMSSGMFVKGFSPEDWDDED